MTAGDKVAVEDAVEVENPGRIRAIRRGNRPATTHAPAYERLGFYKRGEAGACYKPEGG